MTSPTTTSRINTAYARAQKCRDPRASIELQRLVLHTGERLIRIIPEHNVLEPSLDDASLAFALGSPTDRLVKIARLAGLFLECDTLGYGKLTHIERQNCRALIARHDAAEGPGNHIADIAAGH